MMNEARVRRRAVRHAEPGKEPGNVQRDVPPDPAAVPVRQPRDQDDSSLISPSESFSPGTISVVSST